MNTLAIQVGQTTQWEIRDFLGKGYSGEVYRVVHHQHPEIEGVLKKPDITNKVNLNQAGQIERELRILEILAPKVISVDEFSVKVCHILDRSKKGTEATPGFFIVTAKAEGKSIVDLASDYKALAMKFPRLILLRALYGLHLLLQSAHNENIIWNDVKPEHLFWDSESNQLTVIDWANGEFVESNGVTRNQNFSFEDDYFSYIERLSSFVGENDPELYLQLNWPNSKVLKRDPSLFAPLIEKISVYFQEETNKLKSFVDAEFQILSQRTPRLEQFQNLLLIHQQIRALGEKPELARIEEFARKLATHLITTNQFADFDKFIVTLLQIEGIRTASWELLLRINRLIFTEGELFPDNIGSKILIDAINDEWELVLWELFKIKVSKFEDDPDWWNQISVPVRRNTIADDSPYPRSSVQTLLSLLSSNTKELSKLNYHSLLRRDIEKGIKELDELIEKLTGYIFVWKLNPAPKGYGLQYPLLGILEDLENLAGSDVQIRRALEDIRLCLTQPSLFIKEILADWATWGYQDYDALRAKLPNILAWDPDITRLSAADSALLNTQRWRDSLRQRPDKAEYANLIDIGEGLRIGLADSDWLSSILVALRLLASGSTDNDVIRQVPSASNYLPWLKDAPPKPSDPELAALENFYKNLKMGKFDDAKQAIREETSAPFFIPYVNAVEITEVNLGLTSSTNNKQSELQFSFKDENRDTLNSIVKLLTSLTTTLRQKSLRHSYSLFLEYSHLKKDWNFVNAAFDELDSLLRQIDIALSEVNRWLEPDTSRTTFADKSKVDVYAVLVDAISNLQEQAIGWNRAKQALGDKRSEFNKAFAKYLIKNSLEVREFDEKLDSSIKGFTNLAHWLKYFQTSKTYTEEDKENAEKLLLVLIAVSCKGMPSQTTRQTWLNQFTKIRYGDIDSKELAFKALDKNHPLYKWLVNFPIPVPSPPLPPPPPRRWGLIFMLLLFLGTLAFFGFQHWKCKLNPNLCEPPPPIPTASIQPTEEQAKATPLTPTSTPVPTFTVMPLTPTLEPVPDSEGTQIQPPGFSLSATCNQYLQLFQNRAWDAYSESIAHLSDVDYETIKDECLWSYSKEQKVIDIDLRRAADAFSQGDEKSARQIIEKMTALRIRDLDTQVLPLLISKIQLVNAMCNLTSDSVVDIDTIRIFVEYADWLIQDDELNELLFNEICKKAYPEFRSELLDDTKTTSLITSTDYISNSLLDASRMPAGCNYISQEFSFLYPLQPNIKDCFQYGEVNSSIDPSQQKFIGLSADYCFSSKDAHDNSPFGVVISQTGFSEGIAFVLTTGSSTTAYLIRNSDSAILDESKSLVNGDRLTLERSALRLCQPMSIQVNKLGNIVFLGNEIKLPRLLPGVMPDDLRFLPLQFALLTPAFTDIQIELNHVTYVTGEQP